MTALAVVPASDLWPQLLALYSAVLLPLVVGLPPLAAIIESVHVMTGRAIWQRIARFWGGVFGIALALAGVGSVVLTALYASEGGRLAGRIQGLPDPLQVAFGMPFVLAAGLLLWLGYRDWSGAHPLRHLCLAWAWLPLTALPVLVLALGYGWLEAPVASVLDPGSLQVRVADVPALWLNPAAQVRFVHLMAACYLTGAMLVLSTSAWYLLRRRNMRIARRSFTVAASFGLAAALSVAVLGDRAGYAGSPGQRMRIAAIAGAWHTQPAPAAFTLVGFPDTQVRATRAAVDVPWLLGLAATHSWRAPVAGLDELEAANAARIRHGRAAFTTPDAPWAEPRWTAGVSGSRDADPDLGYALLLLRHAAEPARASDAAITAAARATLPNVPLLFWSFRAVLVLGAYTLGLFVCAFWLASRRRIERRGFLHLAAWSLPVPWLAGALGWVLSEAGRGVWLVDGLLPAGGWRSDPAPLAVGTLACVAIAILAAGGGALLVRRFRLGPDGLKLWPADAGRSGSY